MKYKIQSPDTLPKLPAVSEDTDELIKKIISMVKDYAPNANTDMIDVAYRVAKSAHKGQKRNSGEPYITHPTQMAYIAAELNLDATAICAALLHDVIEDTPFTYNDIKTLFGENVAEIVDGVTKLRKIKYNTHEEQQVENLRKMLLAMSKDIRVILIKLIDRLHNMRTLKYMPPKKQLIIAKETLDVYAPLAHRLGISKIKIELEDLSLKYLDPVAYEEIAKGISQKKEEREHFVSEIIKKLEEKLKELGIEGQVTGRAKHFYSIFRKMYAQNKTLDEIYDLFAVRIIVNSVADCYAALGMVHEMYTPIPMRFKDYIAMPKPNMYQSLHTTVIGREGMPFEIQIRTWEMHRIAEDGIAAHWKYKEGISGKTDMDSKLGWVKQMLDNQVDIMDADDFMNTIKLDLFSEEVFVFTPKGKVVSLSSGSTVIDFAFAIHTGVGCSMSGAKVNGKIVPNTYVLQNGDIVEILTSPNVKGPSRDWLKIVKTSQAKTKINQWFKKECRDENIVRGRELIEREIRRLNLSNAHVLREEWLAPMYKKYTFGGIDDLYASVGYGGLSAQKVVMRLREEYIRERKEKGEAIQPTEQRESTKRKRYNNGVKVEGIDNCLVRLAKCCNPVPGDEIKGFITKGRGVSVHRADCPNIGDNALSEEDRGRFIGVSWEKESGTSYVANIMVECEDRPGMMTTVSAAFTELKINCVSITARVAKNGTAFMTFGLEITDAADLKRAVTRIRQISGVKNVTRNTN